MKAAAAFFLFFLLTACQAAHAPGESRTFSPTDRVLANPLTGNAVWAEDLSERARPFSLVYANLTWAELEPEEGRFAFEEAEERYHFSAWRKAGKHLILRFVMDMPSRRAHTDLPAWLAARVSGSAYRVSYGSGWCPDYADPGLIRAHRRVIAALGARYDDDPFVSFVELGSLGHWGEWHVHRRAGAMPREAVRDEYIQAYLDAFQKTHLMMRRPFRRAKEAGMGLFNDASGDLAGTLLWLDWIENGGSYEGEPGQLVPMADSWKTAPVGGELTSGVAPGRLLQRDEDTLAALFRLSHTSWIGPNSFAEVEKGKADGAYDLLMRGIGYRLRVTRCDRQGGRFRLFLTNDGIAPFYDPWPVRLKTADRHGTESVLDLPLDLRTILPGEEVSVEAGIPPDTVSVCLAVFDPMTGLPAVHFAMDAEERDGWTVLLEN